MEKKYRTEPEDDMLRIIALKDFSDVKKGDKGGLIAREDNLSQDGDCWVYEDAMVSGHARIYENAKIYGKACVSENAKIYNNARVYGTAWVSGHAYVKLNAEVYGDANVFGHALVSNFAKVSGNAQVYDNAKVYDCARICGNANVFGDAVIYHDACVSGKTQVYGFAKISGNVKLWSTYDTYITADSIENNKDYVILGIRDRFYIFPFLITGIDYIKNLKTIRQLYGEEI